MALNFGEMGLGFKFYVIDNASAAFAKLDNSIKKFSMDAELAAKKADESLKNIQKSFGVLGSEKVQSSLRNAGKTITAIGLGAVASLGVAAKSYASFEEELYGAMAQAELTRKEMNELGKAALNMASRLPYLPAEIASAMREIAAAGVEGVNNIKKVSEASLIYATATRTTAEVASGSIISTLFAWRKSANEAMNVADQLAKAMAMSKMNAEDFRYALASVGGVAAITGQKISSTLAPLIAMTNAGIGAQDAATSLRSAFLHLMNMSGPAQAALQMLGLSMSDLRDKSGAFKQWPELVATFEKAFTRLGGLRKNLLVLKDLDEKSLSAVAKELGLTKQSLQDAIKAAQAGEQALKEWALSTIFGSDAIRAISISLNTGSKALNNYAQQLEKANGKAKEMANIQMQSLSYQAKRLWSSIQVLGVTFGSYFAPILKHVAGTLTRFVNWFNKLPDSTKKVIGYGIALAGTLMITGGMFMIFLSKITALAQTLATLKSLGGMVGVIRSVGSALSIFFCLPLGGVRNVVGVIRTALGFLGRGGLEVGRAFLELGKTILGGLGWIIRGVGIGLRLLGNVVLTGIRTILIGMGPIGWVILGIAAAATFLFVAWRKNWFGIRDITHRVVTSVTTFFRNLGRDIATTFNNLVARAKDFATRFVEGAISTIKSLPSKIWDILMQIPGILKRAASSLFKAAKNTFSNLWTGFKEALGIKSPSYIEKSMMQITRVTSSTVENLKASFREIASLKAYPKLGLETQIATASVPRTYEQVNVTPNIVPNVKLPLIVKTATTPTTTTKTVATEPRIVTKYLAPVKLVLDGRVIGETVIEFIEDYQTRKVVPTW